MKHFKILLVALLGFSFWSCEKEDDKKKEEYANTMTLGYIEYIADCSKVLNIDGTIKINSSYYGNAYFYENGNASGGQM